MRMYACLLILIKPADFSKASTSVEMSDLLTYLVLESPTQNQLAKSK